MAAPLKLNIKEKILDATVKLLQNTSFEDITLAKISECADISKGTLYYHYNSKDAILFDITEQYLIKLADDLTSWVENKQKDTTAPRLFKYVLERGSGVELGNLRLYLIGAAVSGNDLLKDRYLELLKSFKENIAKRVAQRIPAADAEHLTWVLLTVMDGILVQQQLHNNDFNSEDFIEKTVSLLCK